MSANDDARELLRYGRQVVFEPLGLTGQRRLARSRAVIVGVGGLGSWIAELLARAGAGFLRLVDNDRVELTNIHRQGLYDQAAAAAGVYKVDAAAARLGAINSAVAVEPVRQRLTKDNVAVLAGDVDLIIDGTDNFPTRFVLNDFAVKTARPWVFAGVVGAQGQTMTIIPGRTACLRCIYDQPPPPCKDPTCAAAGVLGPAVAAIAAVAALEAMKILSGCGEQASPYLLKMDFWSGSVQRIDATAAAADVLCRCCKQKLFDFMD